jgi:hypothetical protein
MMGDANGCRRGAPPVIRPTDEPGEYVFRPLQPFETDNGCSSHLRVTLVNCHVGKHINFLTRRHWLDGLSASVLGNVHKFAPSAHQSAMGALDLSRGRRFRPVFQKTPFGDLPDLEAHVAIVSHEVIEIGFAQHE